MANKQIVVSNAAPQPLEAGKKNVVKITKGQHIRVQEMVDGQVKDAGNVVATKKGNSLHLKYADGTELQLEGFYSECAGNACGVTVAGKDAAGTVIGADTTAGAAVGDGGQLVYAYGEQTSLMAMASGDAAMTSALGSLGEGVVTYAPAAAAGAGMSAGALAAVAGGVGVAAAAGGGGSAVAGAAAVGFKLAGVIALGKINDTTGLTLEAFKADGTPLAATATLNPDGSFNIDVTENYSGPVLLRLSDSDPGTNYNDEGTGAAKDLGTDLRALVNVSGNGTTTINITPLTELAARELLGDAGGDGGTAGTTLGGTVTTAQVTAANASVGSAFGLSGDITTTTPATVDDAGFATAATAAQAYGRVLAAISGAEANTGQGTGDVLNTLAQGIQGGTADQAVLDLLIAGANTSDGVAGNATGSAAALSTAIGGNISQIDISADTGNPTDFITQTAAQTITATLDAALSGTLLWGSVDGGATWTDITAFVVGTTLTWTGVTLAGDSSIRLAITADTVTAFTGASADLAAGTKIAVQSYSIDTTQPTFTSSATANFAENGTGAAYQATVDDAHLVTYSLGGADAARFNLDPNSGVVRFIASPNFEAPADTGTDNVYDITVTATDGAGNSATQNVAITVTNVNEAPTLTSGATASVDENTATSTAVYTATATDPDAGATLTYALGGADAAFFNINANTGAVTFKASPNFEAPADSGADNIYNITVTASDGANTTAAQAVAITVTNVNEAPTVTSGATASVAENTATSTAVYTATATDPDAGTTLAYALGGTDAAAFDIDANTGAVTFKASPDFETKSSYSISVSASDGTNTSAAQAVTISVTNVNEAPTAVGTVAAQTAVNGQAFSVDVSGNFADVDASDTLTYAATGLPSGITINSSTGVISGTATADQAAAQVTVTVTDSGGLTATQNFNLGVVSAPVINALAASATEAETGDALTFTATLSEAVTVNTGGGTPTLTLDVGGTSLTATYTGGSGTSSLTFSATVGAGNDSTVTVTAINLNGATVTGNSSAQPLVTTTTGQVVPSFVVDNANPVFSSGATANFAENATGTAYASAASDATALTFSLGGADAALFNINTGTGALSFKTAPNFEAPADGGADNVYDVTVTATDALGHTSNQAVAITVTDVNEAPTLTSGGTASVAENTTSTVYTATATDPDAGATLTYALGGTDAALFNINANTGAVTFKTAPNFEAPADSGADNIYNITVTASDGTNTTAAQAVAITVTNVNEAPTVTSGATASVAENTATSTAVYTATATDPDASTTLTYALGGADAALFNINTSTGAITFKASPNFEAPADSGGNNVYDVTVTASDGTNTTAPQAVAITVTNVNEAPSSTAVTASNAVINEAYSFDVSGNFSDADAGDTLTYAATGLPTGLSINTSTGVITGTATSTTTASVTVTATDGGGLTTSQTFNLLVVEAPVLQPSALDDVTNFDVTSNIVLNYSENVTAQAGKYIHIVNDGGTGFQGESATHTQDILVTDTTQVTISGGKVTINPTFDLDLANNYHIEIDAGAFVGVSSGQPTVAFDGTTSLNFATVTPGTNSVANAVQAQMMDTDGALADGYKWLDMNGIGSPSSSSGTALDLGTAAIALVARDYDMAGGNTGIGYDGVVAGDFYVAANNFGANDLIYLDDQGNDLAKLNDLTLTGVIDNGTPPTIIQFAGSSVGASTSGGLGGFIDLTLAGSTASFDSIAAINTALSSTAVISG